MGDFGEPVDDKRRQRLPVADGIGLAPGLTNLLAVTVPGDGPIHIGVVGGVGEQHGDAARAWIWRGAGRTVTSAGTTQHVYRTARRFDVPGFGRRTLWRAGFGEQDQLHADLARPVSTWLGLDPAWASPLLGLAGTVPPTAPYLDRLSGPFAARFSSYSRWSVVVTDATSPVTWASGRRETDATSTVAALCLEPLRAATPAVYAAHQLVQLDDLCTDLGRAGIQIGGAYAGNGRLVP